MLLNIAATLLCSAVSGASKWFLSSRVTCSSNILNALSTIVLSRTLSSRGIVYVLIFAISFSFVVGGPASCLTYISIYTLMYKVSIEKGKKLYNSVKNFIIDLSRHDVYIE